MASSSPHRVVDIHTHMYPLSYISLLESRTSIPLIRRFPQSPDPRYIILPAEAESLERMTNASSTSDAQDNTATNKEAPPALPGRPVTPHYSSVAQKIHFMDTHAIAISVVSLANPWLDFIAPTAALPTARSINAGFSAMCAAHPGRLFFFAALPVTAPPEALLQYIEEHLAGLAYCRGVILGTSGLIPCPDQAQTQPQSQPETATGNGLDDPALLPVLHTLSKHKLPIFLHPHYGLPTATYGARAAAGAYGHVLPLALGFPMETTIGVARMYLAGTFDAVPGLRIILAHSGGTLPFLAGRIESCVAHDGHLFAQAATDANTEGEGGERKKRRSIWEVLREQIYLDAVVYADVGVRAGVEASGGADRMMFGTDHPFFPPLGGDEQGTWESVKGNQKAVERALGEDGGRGDVEAVMGGNAIRVLRLDEGP